MDVYVVYVDRNVMDTGMIVDHYAVVADVFTNKDSAEQLVAYLTKKNKGDVYMEQFTISDNFSEDNYCGLL